METAIPTKQAPGPKPNPILGNILDLKKGMIRFYYDLWSQYGDIVQYKLGPLNSVLFIRPEHVQHLLVKNPDNYVKGRSHDRLRTSIGNGLLTLEGTPWRQQRKLMQPMYTPTNVAIFADVMKQAAAEVMQRWEQKVETKEVVDINLEMARVTMTIILRAMFGVQIDERFEDIAEALHQLLEYTSSSATRLLNLPLYIPLPHNQRLKRAKLLLHDFIYGIIAQRRREGLRDDLLSLLMSSKDAETGEFMSDEQLHDEVLITIFAGHETTASLLTWAWFLLGKHEEAETQLHAELDRVLGGRAPTQDDLPKLTYTRMVLDETLRLYPPVVMVARDVVKDDVVDGYPIAAGTMAVIMPYTTHRHPEFWERPLEFYPEHFAPEQVDKRPRYAYYPFGAGQRICIGNHFALMESTLVLAAVAQRFQPRLAVPNDGAVKFVGVGRPAKPLLMRIMRR